MMNQLAGDNKQNINCNQNGTNMKNNYKTKDICATSFPLNEFEQDELNEALSNKFHINNINSSLTNGISDYTDNRSENEHSNQVNQKFSKSCELNDVISVHCKSEEVEGEKNPLEPAAKSDIGEASHNNHCAHGTTEEKINIVSYESELQMPEIMRLIQKDLSEPYSIYTYRYFIHNWPKLCFLATHEGKCIGAIVCKLDMHRNVVKRGYIAMLAVDEKYRKRKIGSRLVQEAIQAMIEDNAYEVVLETEITNKPALKLYENLGFVRDKRLFRYYLNGVDALRLKLWLR